MPEQIGVQDAVLVQVTRAQVAATPADNMIFALIILAVIIAIIFIYYKIKK